MAYSKDGYPTELANKVGHIKLISDPFIQKMVEAFEDWRPESEGIYPKESGTIDLEGECLVDQIITVDGGHQAVPNLIRPERQVGFVQVAAQMIKLQTLDFLRSHPMSDPRKVRRMLGSYTHHTLAAIPIIGVHLHGMTVQRSIREAIHRYFSHYGLYEALSYLVYRRWEDSLDEAPSMMCTGCGSKLYLPRDALTFECNDCGEEHQLSDYLMLVDDQAEDRSTAETVSNLRAAIENLVLFTFIIKFRYHADIMRRTLFVLDGPLTLRAQLARLVEPIRAFISDQANKELPLNLVGIEKSGDIRDFADTYSPQLQRPGSFFLPDTRFIVEEIYGRVFTESTYRNRVGYGAKVIARIGVDHVVVMDVPTGEYLVNPSEPDLIGFGEIVRTLSKCVSYAHENAVIPLVLANSEASLSNQPSNDLLGQFVERLISLDEKKN